MHRSDEYTVPSMSSQPSDAKNSMGAKGRSCHFAIQADNHRFSLIMMVVPFEAGLAGPGLERLGSDACSSESVWSTSSSSYFVVGEDMALKIGQSDRVCGGRNGILKS
jgi:hypothetical protein